MLLGVIIFLLKGIGDLRMLIGFSLFLIAGIIELIIIRKRKNKPDELDIKIETKPLTSKMVVINLAINFSIYFVLLFCMSYFTYKKATVLGALCFAFFCSLFFSLIISLKDWDRNQVFPFTKKWFEGKSHK